MGAVRYNGGGVVLRDFRTTSGGAEGEGTAALGRAAGAVAAVGLHLYKYLPPRIHRRQVLREVWRLDGNTACLLLLHRAPLIVRHRQGLRRSIAEARRGRRRHNGG